MLQRHTDAVAALDRLLQLEPEFPRAIGERFSHRLHDCDWRGYDAEVARLERALRAGARADDPFNTLRLPLDPDVLLACAETTARDVFPSRAALWNGERYGHERIRVAYLSADFHAHATSYLMAGLFERHDRGQFEVFGLSYGPAVEDAMRRRLKNGFEHFMDVSLASDLEIARRLRALEIDIAVDLKGYTRHGRLGILSHRPAPIQATYLGFPGALGTRFVDYVLADRTIIPAAAARHYTERVAYLPHCYQVTDDRREIASSTPSRAACGLPDAGFVFCCMNAVVKITPSVFGVWMELLRTVEGSVLWLLDSHAAATRNLRSEAAARGIDPRRLVFAPRLPQAEHLARYRVADLFLDTLPYNAHTTASDALWAGLPVLTCRGETFAARVGASIDAAAGIDELVTNSLADYGALAVALARDPRRLEALRRKLVDRLRDCPLFDTDLFRRHLEAAYREMHGRQQRGDPPMSFAVPAE
jgi:predicted O-linked N-acetylglucosamine transferase (SPINDLY family)